MTDREVAVLDRMFGAGQWVRCDGCPRNGTDQPFAWHHRGNH